MDYLQPYVPIGFVLIISIVFFTSNIVIGRLIGPQRPNPAKGEAYESGMKPIGEANVRIPVKFYLVGLIFLLFDIEAVFILTWAVVFNDSGIAFESATIAFSESAFRRFAFAEMMTFIAILMVGYVYVWRKGGFRWT